MALDLAQFHDAFFDESFEALDRWKPRCSSSTSARPSRS